MYTGKVSVTKPIGLTMVVPDDYPTLEDADGNIGPGNTLQIKAGTYSAITWNESGTAGNEIVIEAFGDGDVFIDGESKLVGDWLILDGGVDMELMRLQGNNNILLRVVGAFSMN